jgi:hypothetical protein
MRDSHLNAMRSAVRSALVTLVAAATILTFGVSATVNSGIRLLANTLLVMGGNTNPAGLTPKMQQQLGGDPWYPDPNTDKLKPVGVFGQGYIDAQNNPGSPYFGWDFNLVDWPAQIGLKIKGEWTYEESQQQGVHNIDWAIRDVEWQAHRQRKHGAICHAGEEHPHQRAGRHSGQQQRRDHHRRGGDEQATAARDALANQADSNRCGDGADVEDRGQPTG